MVVTDITTLFVYSETHYNTHFTTLVEVNFTVIIYYSSDHNIQSCNPFGSNQNLMLRMNTFK